MNNTEKYIDEFTAKFSITSYLSYVNIDNAEISFINTTTPNGDIISLNIIIKDTPQFRPNLAKVILGLEEMSNYQEVECDLTHDFKTGITVLKKSYGENDTSEQLENLENFIYELTKYITYVEISEPIKVSECAYDENFWKKYSS